MALRLIEVLLNSQDAEDAVGLMGDCTVVEIQKIKLADDNVLLRVLMDAEQSESVLDPLEKRFGHKDGARILVMPIEATLPRVKVEEKEDDKAENGEKNGKRSERISREELYEDIKNGARLSRVYLAMVVLSTMVAAIGLQHNNVAVIIGAMVIAPLLGPNVALSLGTTLGDWALLRQTTLTGLAGVGVAFGLAVAMGLLFSIDLTGTEIAARTSVRVSDVVVALASGSAGALALTSGVSATMIGVMVAVALLPPLVTAGLLLGGGAPVPMMAALSLFLVNLLCINLAGVLTFVMQGIKPTNWWEKDRANKATRAAIGLSVTLLAVLIALIYLVGKDGLRF